MTLPEKTFKARSRYKQSAERLAKLTPREREELDLILKGRANKEIAADLGISNRAVETRRAKMMERLEVSSVAELVLLVCLAGKCPQ